MIPLDTGAEAGAAMRETYIPQLQEQEQQREGPISICYRTRSNNERDIYPPATGAGAATRETCITPATGAGAATRDVLITE